MKKELALKMRTIRAKQGEVRNTLANREKLNAVIRSRLTPAWPAKGEEKPKELKELISRLTEGRTKVCAYQKELRALKVELKQTNRAYDKAASVK